MSLTLDTRIYDSLTSTIQSRISPTPAGLATGFSSYLRWKGVVDRAAAAILLIPGLPIIGLLVLLTRLTSRGSAVYRQTRVGRSGRLFVMYKLRTMNVEAEKQTGAVWTTGIDPRITRLGSLLRKLHLDELPQLFNVLRGEMALVGPRPERPEFVQVLMHRIPHYADRLKVLPGITGLAQINLAPDTDLSSVRCKLVLDLEYIDNAKLLLDVRTLLYTLLLLLCFGRSVRIKRLMGLFREVPGSRASANGHALDFAIVSRPSQCVAARRLGPNGPAMTECNARISDFAERR